eukprot:TRINITY_DN64838_c0_g1_i1.p1 TRINITY_DN64838_c0_g1~~TRINITY_DN64838_c0_g1_i1.p1  ORF type:complete len:251 (+),score=36.40 TRINITY_DN64838_c0_g1_i1:118-870(+)
MANEWVVACWDMRNTGVCPRGGAPTCNRCSGNKGATPKGRGKRGVSSAEKMIGSPSFLPSFEKPDWSGGQGTGGSSHPTVSDGISTGEASQAWAGPQVIPPPQEAPKDWVVACWAMRTTGVCPRGGSPNCERCSGKRGATPKSRRGDGNAAGGGGGRWSWEVGANKRKVWATQLKSSKGGKGGGGKSKGSIICKDMKAKGWCPRGDACTNCQAMIAKFGTNNANDTNCWNMKIHGSCKAGDKCKYSHELS